MFVIRERLCAHPVYSYEKSRLVFESGATSPKIRNQHRQNMDMNICLYTYPDFKEFGVKANHYDFLTLKLREDVLSTSRSGRLYHNKGSILTYLLTYSLEQSPSREASWFCS